MAKKREDFAAFILTHGRPDRVYTYQTIKRSGFTGRIVILIDNEDSTAEEYKKKFGDQVYVFDKKAVSETFDEADNFDDRRSIVYARNACFEVAKELGIKYFIQLDDDYTSFAYKTDHNYCYLHGKQIRNLDRVLEMLLNYFKSIPAKSIAVAQGGDFIGGKHSSLAGTLKPKRKCMNTFICSTDRPFQFVGRINEDVNTYTWYQSLGNLFLTISNVGITQVSTQSSKGGMTDIYLDNGTYIKSFYSIIFSPSCVKISMMGSSHRRLHHHVTWKNAVPVIIREKNKKK